MRGMTEAWQRDHGVAPPLREPVVAGDDAAIVALAIDDELIGSQRERAADRKPLPPRALFVERSARLGLSGKDHVEGRARGELHDVRPGREEVLEAIESALAFAVVLEVVEPVGRCLEARAGDDDLRIRRRAIMPANQMMRVTAGQKGTQAELECRIERFISNDGGVFPARAADGLAQTHVADRVLPRWKNPAIESLEKFEAARMDRTEVAIASQLRAVDCLVE